MGRLSFCYESLGLFELAAEWSRKALDVCPKVGHKWERAQYWQTIASCLLDLGDIEGAKAAAKEASNLKPENGDILCTYVFVLDAGGDNSELLAYVEDLQSRTSEETNENLLTMALMANFYLLEVLGHAARAVGKLDFLLKAQETAIEAATRNEDFDEVAKQQNLLAQLYYTQVDDQKKAVELWELVLKSKEACAETIQSASDNLSMVYFAEATASETGRGKGSRHWITKLEKVAKYNHDTREASTSGASLMLGLWHREHDNMTEARNCCRGLVLESLYKLSDDDPYNDTSAWVSLSESLMKAGDRVNAAAAYAVLVQEFDKVKATIAKKESKPPETAEIATEADNNENSSSTLSSAMIAPENTPPSNLAPLRPSIPGASHPRSYLSTSMTTSTSNIIPEVTTSDWSCNGQCRRGVESWAALYMCEICLDSVCFCEQCIDLVKEGKLDFRVCDRGHRWYQAYPIKEGWGKISGETAGKEEVEVIMVNGEAMELGMWLSKLREEWAMSGAEAAG